MRWEDAPSVLSSGSMLKINTDFSQTVCSCIKRVDTAGNNDVNDQKLRILTISVLVWQPKDERRTTSLCFNK